MRMALLEGKKLLITGVLTDDSLAFGVAKMAQAEGAEVVLTGFGRALRLTERTARKLDPVPDVYELDVTDPEPLPDGHPLWTHPRVLITPHVANTPEMGIPLLASHIEQNVARFRVGDELLGVVDTSAGY